MWTEARLPMPWNKNRLAECISILLPLRPSSLSLLGCLYFFSQQKFIEGYLQDKPAVKISFLQENKSPSDLPKEGLRLVCCQLWLCPLLDLELANFGCACTHWMDVELLHQTFTGNIDNGKADLVNIYIGPPLARFCDRSRVWESWLGQYPELHWLHWCTKCEHFLFGKLLLFLLFYW